MRKGGEYASLSLDLGYQVSFLSINASNFKMYYNFTVVFSIINYYDSHVKILALLVQLENILAARWRPDTTSHQRIIAFCTGTPRVYFWSKHGIDTKDSV